MQSYKKHLSEEKVAKGVNMVFPMIDSANCVLQHQCPQIGTSIQNNSTITVALSE